MLIAPEQKKQLDLLRSTLKQVEGIVGRDARPGFLEITSELNNWTAKIAVIGQVKAGKSTFMNAFLGQPDFLPSDVLPWTSVVTNIRINLPNDPLTGARFDFFNEDDWREIMEGNTKVRALAEELLPGFDSELLRRQSQDVLMKTQKRLGQHYHTLLGSKHEYDFLTPDLLKRYVCAGPGSESIPGLEGAQDSLGRYAALTKYANVYMRMPEFQVPTILTDTPGVNDPFLLRDEITCRSLDRSDIFIVVLSAHQALTEVDVALIRILARQDSKDVIIFINRIDELDDFATQVPKVIDDVSRRLTRAIPDIDFKILAGSAFMAEMAIRDDANSAAVAEQMDNANLYNYLKLTFGHVPESREDRLLLASGIDRIKETLSEVIDNGTGCQQLMKMQEDLRAEIGSALFSTRRERESLQQQVERLAVSDSRDVLAALEQEIAQIEKVQAELNDTFDRMDEQIEKITTRSWSRLEQGLNGAVQTFVDDQRQALESRIMRDSIGSGRNTRALTIDLIPLTNALEDEIAEKYSKARAGVDVVLGNSLNASQQIISDRVDALLEGLSLNELPHGEFASTLTMVKKHLEVALVVDKGWAFWRKGEVNSDKTMDAVRALTAAELHPAIQKLLRAFNEALVERAQAGAGRIRILQRMVENSLSERRGRLRRDRRTLDDGQGDGGNMVQVAHRLQSQLEVLERRLQLLSISDDALSRAFVAKAA